MSYFKAEMHQIRFRPGLCPGPRWGSLQRFPRTRLGRGIPPPHSQPSTPLASKSVYPRLCFFSNSTPGPIWWKWTKKCDRESVHRRTHTRTDAKRIYYLSHAICYSYGAVLFCSVPVGRLRKQWLVCYSIVQRWGLYHVLAQCASPVCVWNVCMCACSVVCLRACTVYL